MKRLLTTDKAKTIISSLVLCAMVTAAFVTPANAYDYKAKFIQEANWLTTQQVTSGGNLGGIVEGEDYTTVVETDNTQEAIWIWSRYAELTGDYTKYITNINNAWTYCLAFPAWTEGGTPTTPLPYYSTYNIGWGLLAEMKYRQVYLGRAEYVNHTSYGTSCANTLVSYTPGTSNATDALCLGIASGALYKYGVDVNSITYKNRAVVLGGSVRTWLGTTSNFAAESWAVSGGIAVWGVLNSYYQDPCNASGAAAWAETANTYMPLNAMNGSTNNYEYGMDGWYSWGHYALIQYRGADSFTKYNNVINKILDSDNDHDGGIRQGLTYADTSDYGWATDIPQFGVNYGLIGTTTYTVSGTITSGGSPLAGVLIRGLPGTNLTDANSWPVTDANGFYTTQVPAGFYGTVTPAKVGYSFSPANRTYSNLSSNQTAQNYTAATSTYVQLLDSWVTGTTHTKVTGTNRALVFVAHAKTSGVTLNTVTYGGQGMTKIIDKIIGSSSSRAYVAAFILKDANIVAATNTTFTPTWSGTAPTTVTYTSVLLQDVNQTTLTGASASNGLTTVYSVATTPIATSNGDMIIENAASSVVGTYLPTTGWTKDIDLSATGYDGMDAHRNAAGINETPAITQASANQSIIGFVVKAAPPSVTRKLTVSSSANGTVTTPGIGDFNYPDGTYASIVASASANYHFVNWTGSAVTAGKVASPNSPSTTVLMDANYTVQANFTIDQKSLTTSASSGGTVTTPGIGTYWYDYNSPASIVASANANYHFVNWTGSAVTAGKVASPNSLSTTVLMDANYAVQANFVKDQRSLLTSASGGGTVTTPGIGTYWYDYNTPAGIVASNNANYHFVNWTGTAVTAGKVANPTSPNTTVLMDANYTVQANFVKDQRSLLTSASSGGTVTTPGIGTYWYDYNTPASIVASNNANYHFVNWTGTAVTAGKVANPTSPNTTVLMDANYTVQANFVKDQRSLLTSASGGGTVTTPGIGTYWYDYNTPASIVASNNANYHFVNWTGTAVTAGKVASPTSATTTVTMDANYTVQANFAIDQKSLLTSASSGGTVTTPGIGTYWYDYNSPAGIVASAVDPNYQFVNWTGTAVTAGKVANPTSPNTTVLMDANYTVQANFNPIVPDVVGMTQAAATTAITAIDNLTVGNVTQECSDTVAAGLVISQSPIGGTQVNIGSSVDIVVSLGLPIIPDVTGKAQAVAEANIVAATFTVGNVTTAYSDTVAVGNVISQLPIGGTAATSGTAVDIVVSLGLPIIPDVTGKAQAVAEANIVAATFTVGNVTTAYSDTVAAGNVISQLPIGGTAATSGTAVDLVVSNGPQPLQVRDDFNDNRRGAMWLVSVEQNAGITEDANRLNITAVGGQMDLVTPCIGHWKMNDNAANKTVLDSSDANHNGTAARDTNVLATTGKINGALIFNGTSDYIDVGNVIGTGAYTKVAWVKRADTNGTVYNNIISTGNTDYSHIFWAPSAYSFKLSAGNMNANRVQDPNSLAPDVWYQVAVTFDPNVSSGKMVLYKNGAQVASATSVPTQSSSPKTYIGRYASGYYFKGTIDNVMIFNKALTADEIAALYNTGSGTETMPASAGGSGEYSANGWSIDANENFQAKVDFHYITASGPAGWVAITIESNYDNYVSIIAGADGNLPYFEYEKVVDGNVTSAQASRGSNDGTLYISYDAALDELYLSYSDYGAGNAWQTITGLLAGQWYSESVRIAVGGGSAGDVIDNNQAYLDNFEVTSGLLIGWPPVTDIDGNGYIEWLDLEIMCENWLQTGSNVPGDIHKDEDNIVNFLDFADFTLAW